MLGHATPDQAAPDGAHIHTIHTVGNRATGDMLRCEHCDTCPRETDIEADPETVIAGWAHEDTDRTTEYVPASPDSARSTCRTPWTGPNVTNGSTTSPVRHGTRT